MEYLDKAGLTHLWTQIINKINSSGGGSSGGSSSIKELTGTYIPLLDSTGMAEDGTIYHIPSGASLTYDNYTWSVDGPALAYLSYKKRISFINCVLYRLL